MYSKILEEIERLKPRMLKFAQELIRIPSVNPPGDESEVAEVIRQKLGSLGLKVELLEPEPKRVNVLATLKGIHQTPSLLFNGHTDVVPVGNSTKWSVDPFSAEVRSGWLYGRGAADMKGAIASIVTAIEALVNTESSLEGNVILHAVADEEISSKLGTKYIIKKGIAKADMGIVMESSVCGGKIFIRPAVRGTCWVRLQTFGKAGHASRPKKGTNAVLSMAKLLLALENLKLDFKTHKYLPDPTICPGTIVRGGVKTNIIPEHCTANVDVRLVPSMRNKQVLEHIQDLARKIQVKAEAEIISSSKPAELPEDAEIINVASWATKNVVGYEPKLKGGYGTNDSTYLINNAKIPTLCGLGPGDSKEGNAHGADEKVKIKELLDFTKIYALIIAKVCKVRQ